MALQTLHTPKTGSLNCSIILLPSPLAPPSPATFAWLQPPNASVHLFAASSSSPHDAASALANAIPPGQPALFLAHSLAGVVLKLALFTHSLEFIFGSVLFFGVCHTGDVRRWVDTVFRAHNQKGNKKEIETWVQAAVQTVDWQPRWKDGGEGRGRVVSFWETRKSKVGLLNWRIVTDAGMAKGIDGGAMKRIERDHTGVMAFGSVTEAVELGVWVEIEEAVRTAVEMARKEPEEQVAVEEEQPGGLPSPAPPPFNVLESDDHVHIPRPTLGSRLDQIITNQPVDATRVIAVYGTGGSGKTQAVLSVLKDLSDTHYLVWINAATLTDDVRALSRQIYPPTEDVAGVDDFDAAVKLVNEWLAQKEGQWVFVVDNIDTAGLVAAVEGLVPESAPPGGRVLFVGQMADSISVAKEVIEVPGMTETEALSLLAARLSLPSFSARQLPHAQKLISTVHHLPLALDLLAAQIYDLGSQTSLEDFTNLSLSDADITSPSAAVEAIWTKSLSRTKELNPTAHALLLFFSFLSPTKISESLFSHAATGVGAHVAETPETLSTSTKSLPEWLQTLLMLPWNTKALLAAITTLSALRLVRRVAHAGMIYFATQPTLHAAGLRHVRSLPLDEFQPWLTAALTFLSSALPSTTSTSTVGLTTKDALLASEVAAHFSVCYALAPPESTPLPWLLPELNWLGFAELRSASGAWTAALDLQHLVLARLAKSLSDAQQPDALGLATANLALAASHQRMGSFDAAIVAADAAVSIRTSLLGDAHADTLAATSERAGISVSARDWAAAVPELLAVLRATLSLHALDTQLPTPLTAPALHSILRAPKNTAILLASPHAALLLITLNNLRVAIAADDTQADPDFLVWLTDAYTVLHGASHLETLRAKQNLAVATHDAAMLREVYDARTKSLGKDHPETLAVWHNLAQVVGVVEEGGEEWLRKAIDTEWDVIEAWERAGRCMHHPFLKLVEACRTQFELRLRMAGDGV